MQILETNRSKEESEEIAKLYRLRSELTEQDCAEYRPSGALIRSTARWHEHGKKIQNIS